MRKTRCVFGLVLLSVSSITYALDAVGPPMATLGRDRWSLGIEYVYSEMNTELTNVIFGGGPVADVSSRGLTTNRVYVTPKYGALDQVDVFARLGAVTMESPVLTAERFHGDADVAWGFGAAVTVFDSDQLSWGVLAQWSHGQTEAHQISPTVIQRAEMETESLQVATGPTYVIRGDLSFYGGAFYHALDGEYRDSVGIRFDLAEDSAWGGFIGLDWAVKEDAYFHAEVQHTGTATAIAAGLRWRFP